MKGMFKIALCSAAMVVALNANALQQDITVTADIDPTVSISKADGAALPDSITMQYRAGQGLVAYKENVKLWSNAADKDLMVSLSAEPKLTDPSGQGSIPLSVLIDGKVLSTTQTTYDYKTTFPSGIKNGSSVMPLVITQKSAGEATVAGKYTGLVSLIISQATTSGEKG
ncbi:fimbrial protein [Salmonella enterica subsp. enterica serovar Choleraesuis]|nr:fimbrial protein [Salmonella enterica subsp. enterica serovar Choleraesuis]